MSLAGPTLALGLALAPGAESAEFTLRSEVDARRVGVEDQLQLTISVEGSGAPDEVPLPALANLDVVAGPYQSSQISVVNGRMSQSRSLTWVLRPRAAGKAEVGAVQAGGQTAPAIAIEVVAGSVQKAEPQRGDPMARDPFGDPLEEFFGRRRPRASAQAPRLAMQAEPSRTRLKVGEPLVLTYWLYTQTAVADLQFKDAPQFAGFWVEDLERDKAPPSGEPATIEGQSYRRFPVLRKLLFPTKAGTLTIPASTFRVGLARTGFFDAGGSVERSTQPVTVTVEPLPEAPGYAGAVGRFRAEASLDRDSVPLGEAATLRFRVIGTGNLKWIDRGPELAVPGAKVFPPQTKSELRATPGGIAGSRTWEFVVVPETSGSVEIPKLAFSYFDPSAGRIVASEAGPLALRVEGGTLAAGAQPAPAASAAARATGALPLRSELDLPAAGTLGGRSLAALAGVALLLHAGLWAAPRLRGAGARGGAGAAPPRSLRAALRDLERAGEAPSKEQAASLVEKALHEAFGDVPDADDSERARTLRALVDEVRFVRYAPQLGDYSDALEDLTARAAAAVRRWA